MTNVERHILRKQQCDARLESRRKEVGRKAERNEEEAIVGGVSDELQLSGICLDRDDFDYPSLPGVQFSEQIKIR